MEPANCTVTMYFKSSGKQVIPFYANSWTEINHIVAKLVANEIENNLRNPYCVVVDRF